MIPRVMSKTTLPSLRRITTIDPDNSSKMLCPICLKVLIRLNQIHQILIKMERKIVKCLIHSKGLMAVQTHRKLSLAQATTLRNLYQPYFYWGGGGWNPLPSGFPSITQKRERLFSSNLATFFIDKWATICHIKLED